MLTFLVSTFCHHYVSHDLTLWPTQETGCSDATAIVIVSVPPSLICLFHWGHMKSSPQPGAVSLHGWKRGGKGERECVKWVRDCKSLPSVYAAAASKGTRTAPPQTYWFISHPFALPRPAPFDCPLLWDELYKWSRQLPLPKGKENRRGSKSGCPCPRCHCLWTCKSHHLCADAIRTAAASHSNKVQMVQMT